MRVGLGLIVAVVSVACGGPSVCVDEDGDGFGRGCFFGDDCDDTDPERSFRCENAPPECRDDRTAPGCPCLAGATSACLGDALDGIGLCRAGVTRCVGGAWGPCEGGVGPTSERCNDVDEDCDGLVDEGVVSPCGGCDPACVGGVWGTGPVPFAPGAGLVLTDFGELTLAREPVRFGHLWIPNTADGTVSRIDTEAAVETARYATGGTEPSRAAVDRAGDVWVLNREFGGTASAVKIAGERERCVDRDGDGLETSGGPSDVLPFGDDECVLLRVPVGADGGVARAIAIDGDRGLDQISGGDAWVGLHDEEAIVELDGLTGEARSRIDTPGFQPYAATFDRWGTLWMIAREGLIARVDTTTGVADIGEVPLACYLLYGIAADEEGRLVVTGFSCDRIAVHDPRLGGWRSIPSPPSPRGVVLGPGDRVWIAHTAGQVSEVLTSPLRVLRTLDLAGREREPFESIGVAWDGGDRVWVASSQGGGDGAGIATRVDPEAGAVTAQIPVGRAPHVQGDLTGSRVRWDLVPSASLFRVFEGCGPEEPTAWLRLHLDAAPGSTGTVRVAARHGASRADLAEAMFRPVGEVPAGDAPFELDLPEGGVVEVRLTLEASGAVGAPRVTRVGVEWACPGPG